MFMIISSFCNKMKSRGFMRYFVIILFCLISSCGEKLKKGSAKINVDQVIKQQMSKNNEWLGHLGTYRNGLSSETNINLEWFESEPERLWKIELGVGVAGVSGFDDSVFTMGNIDNKDVIYCINALNGKTKWRISYDCVIDKRMFEGGGLQLLHLLINKEKLYMLLVIRAILGVYL